MLPEHVMKSFIKFLRPFRRQQAIKFVSTILKMLELVIDKQHVL